MNILSGVCWGFIPARGGSKSIPDKNIAFFAGRPLMDYVIRAAQACSMINRILCSTDSMAIANHCRQRGIEVLNRPPELATDDSPIMDTLEHHLTDLATREGAMAEIIALIQPTSPFLLPEHIDACVGALKADSTAASAQTAFECPHNHHAVNQRVIEDGQIRFRYAAERHRAPDKQSKPVHYLFGNMVVARTEALLAQRRCHATPSLPIIIDRFHALDADGPDDFILGKLMLRQGVVTLDHMD
jgi:CMP-N,N'-diacetyllegionaminic acid synthase